MSQKPLKTQGFAQGLFQQSATQMHDLDTVRYLQDGRAFAYALAGGTLSVGQLNQMAVPSASATDETVYASGSAGDNFVHVTFGGAFAANYFKDGYLWFNDDTGEGYYYIVKDHEAATSGNSYTIKVYLKDKIRLAFTAGATTVSCRKNRQDSVVVFPTSQTGAPAGVNPIAVSSGYYFWNQVKGPAAVLTYSTIVIGNDVVPDTNTAGGVKAGATSDIVGPVGRVMAVNATTEYSLINLAIPGY